MAIALFGLGLVALTWYMHFTLGIANSIYLTVLFSLTAIKAVVLLLDYQKFQIRLLELILVVILGLLASLPAIVACLLIDLIRPYLNWDNPQKSIKQNINVVLAMFVG